MSRLTRRRALVALRGHAAKVKAEARREEPTPPMFEVVYSQPLTGLRQALKVTDPYAPMDQAAWGRAMLTLGIPTPGVNPYSPFAQAASFNVARITEHLFKAPGADFLAELEVRPGWLKENAAELRWWLLWAEFQEAPHEDWIYWRPAHEALAAMFRFAKAAGEPERLTWWAEHLTGRRLTPAGARPVLVDHFRTMPRI